MSDFVLKVMELGKCYSTYRNNFARFANWFGVPARHTHEYWATKDVNFALRRGEALAIIGQNGAGKSTLLKLITGTVRPTTGSVQIKGRISAILELGLGFNPDFTGRQNVYLAGGLMGLGNAELSTLMHSIEEFAEIGEFFDQPLRVYSSGMQARLAFAVATAVRPDVLIVDEVLSVGDSYFQHKSFARIREFREKGTSILLVTHGLGDVRTLCNRVILLDKGAVLKDGLPDEVVDYYNALIAAKENEKLTIEQRRGKDGWNYTRSGTGQAQLAKLEVRDCDTNQELKVVFVEQRVLFHCDVSINDEIPKLVLGILIRNREGLVVWGTNTWHTNQVLSNLHSGDRVSYTLSFACTLGPGSYSISVALVSSDSHLVDNFDWVDNLAVFDVINSTKPLFIGVNYLDAQIVCEVKS